MSRAATYRLALIATAVAALEFACRIGWIDPIAVIAPSKMVQGAVSLLASGQYSADLLLTLQTVAAALVISVFTGFLLGLLLYRLPRLKSAADPFLASYYAIPMFMFYPLFIVMFGLNRWPLVAIGFVFSFIAMAINTVDGLSRVPKVFMRVGQSMNLTAWQRMRFIQLPAAAPYLFTGVKLPWFMPSSGSSLVNSSWPELASAIALPSPTTPLITPPCMASCSCSSAALADLTSAFIDGSA